MKARGFESIFECNQAPVILEETIQEMGGKLETTRKKPFGKELWKDTERNWPKAFPVPQAYPKDRIFLVFYKFPEFL